MDNNNSKNTIRPKLFSTNLGQSSANPFNSGSKKSEISFVQKPQKRLNGYDSTILNNTQFKGEDEPELNIDFKIQEKEQAIKDLDNKIKSIDNYGSPNESLGLKAKKQRYLQELSSLQKQRAYGGRVLGEANKPYHEHLKENMPVLYKVQSFVSRHILAKVSKKVNSVIALSDSLEQLSQISKSVDELIDMNVPYGEKAQNYEKLTDYLNKANSIHSKISKTLRH